MAGKSSMICLVAAGGHVFAHLCEPECDVKIAQIDPSVTRGDLKGILSCGLLGHCSEMWLGL